MPAPRHGVYTRDGIQRNETSISHRFSALQYPKLLHRLRRMKKMQASSWSSQPLSVQLCRSAFFASWRLRCSRFQLTAKTPRREERREENSKLRSPLLQLGRMWSEPGGWRLIGAIPAYLKIARNSFAAMRTSPIRSRQGRWTFTPAHQRHGLVVTIIIKNAQDGIKNRRLHQTKASSPQSRRGVFVANETMHPCFVENRLTPPNHRRIMMHKDFFHRTYADCGRFPDAH